MKKLIRSRIFLVIICGIVFTSIGAYAATAYKASDVIYASSDGTSMNVNDALNDIYNIKKLGNATAGDIASGKTAVVQGKLITGSLQKNTVGNFSAAISIQAYDYYDSRSSTLNFQYKNGSVTLTNADYLSSKDDRRYSFRITGVSISGL